MDFLYKLGYRLDRQLGSGGSGEVYLYTKDGKSYAVKILDVNKLIQPYVGTNAPLNDVRSFFLKLIRKEIKNLEKIRNKGPATCRDFFDFILTYNVLYDSKNTVFYLISEPMTSDLFGFFIRACRAGTECPQANIRGLSSSRDELIIAIICQLVYAVYCLHQIGMVHGDLKPHNIFIDGATGKIKIADFGGSAILDDLETDARTIMSETRHYMAPERLRDSQVTPKIDVWSLGVTILELVAMDSDVAIRRRSHIVSDFLGSQDQETINDIIDAQIKMRDPGKEDWIKWLLENMLQVNPNTRASLHALIYDSEFNEQCKLPIKNILQGTGPVAPTQIIRRQQTAVPPILESVELARAQDPSRAQVSPSRAQVSPSQAQAPSRAQAQRIDSDFVFIEDKTPSQIAAEFSPIL